MKKLLFVLSLMVTVLYGYSYNELLIKAQSSIFPKIMLLDKKLEEKLVEGLVVYSIAYEDEDKDVAEMLKNRIESLYQGRLGQYALRVQAVPFKALKSGIRTTGLYVLNSSESLEGIGRMAREEGILTFAYDMENLKQGILLSLMVEKSTVLYLNKENLPRDKVDFVEALYQIVRFAVN